MMKSQWLSDMPFYESQISVSDYSYSRRPPTLERQFKS